jgi:hypothetical protein
VTDLTPQERVEYDAAVTAAYRTDGETRTHAEALVRFREEILPDAVQAHRRWAHVAMDEALELGLRMTLKGRWKALGGVFHGQVNGRKKTRAARRGVAQVDPESGAKQWTQLELMFDAADDLRRKIAEAVRRMREEQDNIVMFRRLLDLLEQTGASTVERGLSAVGMSLDEYLSQDDQAAS